MDSTRGFKNIIFGFLSKIIVMGFGVLVPRLVLVNLGSESNGLLNVVGTALTYMSLLEAGVGTATLQALYRPVAEGDRDSISRIMSATNFYYRRTGKVYLAMVVVVAVALSIFIRTNISKSTVFIVVLLAGLSGVIDYFFQGKFRILLAAEGKNYVTTNISTIVSVATNIAKVVVLLVGGDVVAVQFVSFVINLCRMAAFSIYEHLHYSWINYAAIPDYDAISEKDAVLVHQVSSLIFGNTDVLVLSLFGSLADASIYTMYSMIYSLAMGVAAAFSEGFTYALGQSFHDRERYLRLFDAYETYNMAFTASIFCICHIIILPFIKLYTAGVEDAVYVNQYLPWLFSFMHLLNNGRASSQNTINIAQRFEDTKWRSVLESAINVIVSLVATYWYGIYGVLIGTIAALLYRTNDMIIYAASILKRSCLITYKRWCINIFVFVVLTLIASNMNITCDSYGSLAVISLVATGIILPMFLVINSLLELRSASLVYGLIRRFLFAKVGRSEVA